MDVISDTTRTRTQQLINKISRDPFQGFPRVRVCRAANNFVQVDPVLSTGASMKKMLLLSVLAALGAVAMIAVTPTSASAFGWCGERTAARVTVAPRARVYGYSTYRRPVVRARVYRATTYRPVVRPVVRRRW